MRGVSPVVRVSCCTDSGKTPETVRKTCPRLLPVEIGPTAWRWGESGANRSRPLDAAIAPRRPPRELAGFGETGLDYVRVRGSWEPAGNPRLTLRRGYGVGSWALQILEPLVIHGDALH